MARRDLYRAPGAQKAAVERQRQKAQDMTQRHADERRALLSMLNTQPSLKALGEWMGAEASYSFTPTQFNSVMPVRDIHIESPIMPSPRLIDRILGRKELRERQHEARISEVRDANADIDRAYEASMARWEARRDKHDKAQARAHEAEVNRVAQVNQRVKSIRDAWKRGDADTVKEFATAIIKLSEFPRPLRPRFELHYDANTKLLIIDFLLPSPSDLPTAKTVRFNQKSGDFTVTEISAKDARILYENICYQLSLRPIRDICRADKPGNIEAIAFNGNVETVNPATGKKGTATIMSLLVTCKEVRGIDFKSIDPRTCFKSLKGVSASSLDGMSAVVPIMSFNKKDNRFIEGREIEIADDGSVNLAAMAWEEFEHLVRQIFEMEFASRGGEVKITQSSSDGGVDAIAFDPDPITGGKIVIQAKRYTRLVGVSAVRDLYGTAQSEGASKGILVTTADFGPDAYRFARDKPIALLNGSHLLHLLEKHGMRAHIDIEKARTVLGLSGRVAPVSARKRP